MMYEGSVRTSNGTELIYFEGPDDLDPITAESMVRDIFGEMLISFRPITSPQSELPNDPKDW